MTNFDKQLNAAVNLYAEMSGISREEILIACQDINSVRAQIVMQIMFAAR